MNRAFATLRDGQVALDAPVAWPDGTRLELRPLDLPAVGGGAEGSNGRKVRAEFLQALSNAGAAGMDESLWPLSATETQLLLDHMDAAEPLDLSPEEQQQWEADRAAAKAAQQELTRKRWQTLDELSP